jgi:hypothetical protein
MNNWNWIMNKIKSREAIVRLEAGTTVFSLKIGKSDNGKLLFSIEDRDEGMSVTNNAAAVIQKVVSYIKSTASILEGFDAIPNDSVIVYRDTSGQWDELLVKESVFSNFGALGVATEDKALSIAMARREKCD